MQASMPITEQRNFQHFVYDIAWFGLAFAATSRFLQFYAIRMGATPLELGWLTSIPSIILLITTNFSAWWRNRHNTSVSALLLPSIGFRLVFLLPAFAPFFPEQWRTLWIILAAALPAFPQGVTSSIFIVMMRESISPEKFTPLVTRRAVAMNVTVTFGAIGFGLLLEALPFPLNYQIMFVTAFIFSLVSLWHVTKVQENEMPQPQEKTGGARKQRTRDLLRSPYFQSVIFVTLVSHVAFFSIFPLITLHLEKNLGATEGFMAFYGVAELLAGAATAAMVSQVVARIGNRAVIMWGMIITALSAGIIALAPALWVTLLGAALSGGAWTAVGIGAVGFFAERTSAEDMQSTVVFHQIIFLSMFIGPMIGSSLADMGINVITLLLGGAGLRLLAAFLTHHGISVFGGKKIKPLRSTI